jgi:hypothetical protein
MLTACEDKRELSSLRPSNVTEEATFLEWLVGCARIRSREEISLVGRSLGNPFRDRKMHFETDRAAMGGKGSF